MKYRFIIIIIIIIKHWLSGLGFRLIYRLICNCLHVKAFSVVFSSIFILFLFFLVDLFNLCLFVCLHCIATIDLVILSTYIECFWLKKFTRSECSGLQINGTRSKCPRSECPHHQYITMITKSNTRILTIFLISDPTHYHKSNLNPNPS